MLAVSFITIAIINALMLIALLGIIWIKNTKKDAPDSLEVYQDILILGLLIGIVLVSVLSIFIIL